ncbi:dihydropteroate synthase [Hyphococcus formosus]|uniref:dihydropteroate synthase n=1 Tax=Hyphococcus formosus TaxID=3143534 RepID=UPI00398AB03C
MPNMNKRPDIMGIINATPDSFSDGGRFFDPETAIAHGRRLAAEGATILDVGGESTRPGADEVPIKEEIARVLPIIKELRTQTDIPISIDTRKPEVAVAAVEAGATIWNDVTALEFSPDSITTAKSLGCDIVLMHAQGDPKNMQEKPKYDDVVEEVFEYLSRRVACCVNAGILENRLIVDPGIGFGKTTEHNLLLLAHLDRLTQIGRPVLLGASRKRFISAVDGDSPPDQRLGGSLAAVLTGFAQGCSIFRVHDVAETRQALNIADAIENPHLWR